MLRSYVSQFETRDWVFLLYFITGSLIGALGAQRFDMLQYIHGASSYLSGHVLYSQPHIAYPPLWYAILALVLAPVKFLGIKIGFNYWVVAAITSVNVFAVLLCAELGVLCLPRSARAEWLLFVLANPLVLVTVWLLGQSDAALAVGLLLAVVAWAYERWLLVGLGVGVAASLKGFPILICLPLLARVQEVRSLGHFFAGLLAPVIPTAVLTLLALPQSWSAFWSRNMMFGLHHVSLKLHHPLGWLLIWEPSLARWFSSWLFIASLCITLLWSSWGPLPVDELRPLIAVLPTIYTYQVIPGHHLLPFAISFAWIAFYRRGRLGRILLNYAIGLSLIGTAIDGSYIATRLLREQGNVTGTIFPLVLGWYQNLPGWLVTYHEYWLASVGLIHGLLLCDVLWQLSTTSFEATKSSSDLS